ncbi:MAG: Holliday junction resolvase [Thermoplasmatales archaeon]|nr:Holliday junction resolvase [Thermoplasmatales archaeon]
MSIYERELKEILSGNREIIERVTKNLSDERKEIYKKIIEYPFITVRAAGSLGIADIVAVRGDISLLAEIKARKEKEILFSHEKGRMQKKAEEMLEKCEKSKVLPIFAYRLKGIRDETWRIFTMDMNIEGNIRRIHEKIPKVEKSKDGNYIMRWEKGMRLSDFISLLNSSCQ